MHGTRLSPDEVFARLPFVGPVAEDAARLSARLAESERTYRRERQRPVPSQAALNERALEMRALRADLEVCTAELTHVGAAAHDAAAGIVDFPGEVQGAPVLLCWKLGEERVDHFHGLGEGHAVRRPLPVPVHAG